MSKRSTIVVIDRKLLKSKAYIDLDGKASKVLLWFLAKRQMYKVKTAKREGWMITNNGEILFTYEEAKKTHGFSPQVFSRLLQELIDKGFIDITTPGIGVGKAATKFAISKRWEKYGTDEFKVFERHKRESYVFPKGKDHPIHKKLNGG